MLQVQIYVLYLSLRSKIKNFLRLQKEVGYNVFLVKLRCLTVVQHQLFV